MKYITKGDLLLLLGDSASTFTQFLLNPAGLGVTEPLLSKIQILKQKFDWTNGIHIDTPEIQQVMQILLAYHVITQQNVDDINSVADNPYLDTYAIYILAQDDITLENQYGATYQDTGYKVTVKFKNNTKNTSSQEDFYFDTIPQQEDINTVISNRIRELKQVHN